MIGNSPNLSQQERSIVNNCSDNYVYAGGSYFTFAEIPILQQMTEGTVVEVGSGVSNVVDELLSRGVEAYGIDPIYGLSHDEVSARFNEFIGRMYSPIEQMMQEGDVDSLRNRIKVVNTFQQFLRSWEENPECYLPATATEAIVPIEFESADIVFSYFGILKTLSGHPTLLSAAISRSLSWLKPGGQLILMPFYPKENRELLKWLIGSEHKFEVLLPINQFTKTEIGTRQSAIQLVVRK